MSSSDQVKEAQFRLSVVLLLFGGFLVLSSRIIEWRTWFNITFYLGLLCLIIGFITGIASSLPSKSSGGPGGI